MSNESEETLYIDTFQMCVDLGLGKNAWKNYSGDDAKKFLQAFERKLDRNPNAEIVQLSGLFPIEISLRIGGMIAKRKMRLEYTRPGVRRIEIFDYRECPELML